jgi:RNA ligase (TIGR02306 family)
MDRKLASIQLIKEILPIEGADAIELAVVNGWKVVVAKNVGHQAGDHVVYCEIDSFLPIREEFEFLRKSSYKKMGDQEGFRLRTIKLRGQVSQGLILPMSIFGDFGWTAYEGLDVTDRLGIVKYEPPIPAELAGKVKGQFPSFLKKTDEERVQNLTKEYEELKYQSKHKFYVTEKLDGSSATFYVRDGEFGVCSRNLELADPDEVTEADLLCGDDADRPKKENSFWKVAKELGLREKMSSLGKNICFQGELIGEGIQGNPYKIKGQTVRFFNVYDIDSGEYYPLHDMLGLLESLELEPVPVLDAEFMLPDSVDLMLEYADGKTAMRPPAFKDWKDPGFEREGVVVRSLDMTVSFKAISNKFLLKNEQ